MPDGILVRWRRWGYGILALLFVCDIITTTIDRMFGHHELNPIMIPYVANPFVHFIVKFMALAIIVGLIESCSLVLKKSGRDSGFVQMIFFMAVFLFNAYYAYGVIANIRVMLGSPI